MIKVFEMFSGYGGASFSLKKAEIPYECVGISEIDKYAVQCYNDNFPNIKNYGDCRNINPQELPDFDLLTGGFPCQSFSVAGKGKGELDPRGTLFYEIIRILEVKRPKYVLLENVKGLTTKTHKDTFNKILSELKRVGYDVIWKVLNTKNYGIPQNRERVFFICKLGKWEFNEFQFPKEEELKITIKDILEEEVDKKYFLSELMQKRFHKYLEDKRKSISVAIKDKNRGKKPYGYYPKEYHLESNGEISFAIKSATHKFLVFDTETKVLRERPRYENGKRKCKMYEYDIMPTLSINCGMGDQKNVIYDRKGFDSRTKGFRENEVSPTLSQKMGTGGNNVPMILTGLQSHQQLKTDGICNALPSEGGGHIPMVPNSSPREVGFKEISPAILSRDYKDPKIVSGTITQAFGRFGCSKEELRSAEINLNVTGSLRRLTPKECFRLMGFLNDEINLDGLSDTQRYKLAGNGWDINLVSKLFKEIFIHC